MYKQTCVQSKRDRENNTIHYSEVLNNWADGKSVVVYVFLKNDKRGGSNKHGGKFYGFYHIIQIGIF